MRPWHGGCFARQNSISYIITQLEKSSCDVTGQAKLSNGCQGSNPQLHVACFSNEGPASWSSGNAFVCGAEGLSFKSRAGQIGHSVANGSPPLRHFFERSCVARAQ